MTRRTKGHTLNFLLHFHEISLERSWSRRTTLLQHVVLPLDTFTRISARQITFLGACSRLEGTINAKHIKQGWARVKLVLLMIVEDQKANGPHTESSELFAWNQPRQDMDHKNYTSALETTHSKHSKKDMCTLNCSSWCLSEIRRATGRTLSTVKYSDGNLSEKTASMKRTKGICRGFTQSTPKTICARPIAPLDAFERPEEQCDPPWICELFAWRLFEKDVEHKNNTSFPETICAEHI